MTARPVISRAHHAEIFTNGNTVPTTLTTAGEWKQFLGFATLGQSRGAIGEPAEDHILIQRAGVYSVKGSFSFSGSNSRTYEVEVMCLNGTIPHPNLHTEIKLNANGYAGSCSVSGSALFTAGATVEVWIRCLDGSNDPTIRDINLSVMEIV